MVECPGDTPVTSPEPGIIVATAGAELLQLPPGVPPWLSGVVLPVHTVNVPLIGPAVGVGSNVIIIAHPVPLPSLYTIFTVPAATPCIVHMPVLVDHDTVAIDVFVLTQVSDAVPPVPTSRVSDVV